MARVTKTIEVDVPVRTAYNQWTQFEEFPKFMEGVHEVHQLDDRRLHWRAEVAGKEEEWEAEIREQIPDEKIIWTRNGGDKLGFMSRRVEGDLERFKEFIESRGVETGAYRETLQNPSAPGGHTMGEPEERRAMRDDVSSRYPASHDGG